MAMSRRFTARAAACVALMGVVACQPQRDESPSTNADPVAVLTASPSEAALNLPPTAEAEIAAIFDPLLEDYGLRVSRAALLSTTEPYEESETGEFLGLYVEPTGEYAPADYVENMAPLARLMIPYSFDRWAAIQIVDVCQEPTPDIDDSEEPRPETQVQSTREAPDQLQWDELDLFELVAAAEREEPRGVILRVSSRIGREPVWREAVEAAEETARPS